MTTYTASMQGTIVPGAKPVTEDFTRVNGIIAGCGQAAMLVVLNMYKGAPATPNEVGTLIQQMVAAHETVGGAAASGQSSPAGLAWLANQFGVPMTSGDPATMLHTYAGNKPIVWGMSNATALGGSDSNVKGHYITIVGKTADGRYIASDPNTTESQNGQFIVYSESQLLNAAPFWAAVPSNPVPSGLSSQTGSVGNCVHSIPLPQLGPVGGGTLCMDGIEDFGIRAALVFGGFVLIILGVLIFGMGNPDVQQAVSQPVKHGKEALKTLASIGALA